MNDTPACVSLKNLTSAQWNEYRSGTDIASVDLSECEFSDANFSKHHLDGADFFRSSFQGVSFAQAGLRSIKFSRAKFYRVDFSDCSFSECDFSGIEAVNCNFENAKFSRHKFVNAIFRECSFQDASLGGEALEGVQFLGCDLRRAAGVCFDDTLVKDTVQSPGANDRWSVLRRSYTGANMVFNLVAMLFFFLPWIAQTAYWSSVGSLQQKTMQTAEELRGRLRDLSGDAAAKSQIDGLLEEYIGGNASRCLAQDNSQSGSSIPGCTRVWKALLGFHEGWKVAAVAIVLLVYNFLRLLLTLVVAPLRDEERRSWHTPALRTSNGSPLGSYGWLWPLHLLVRTLLFVALGVALAQLYWRLSGVLWLGVP